jgi:hypothetical protein
MKSLIMAPPPPTSPGGGGSKQEAVCNDYTEKEKIFAAKMDAYNLKCRGRVYHIRLEHKILSFVYLQCRDSFM